MSITCKCSKVQVNLCVPEMKYHTACFCDDCRERLVLSEKLGGPKMCEKIRCCQEGVENRIFEDSMSISEECKKHLVFVKLAKDSPTTSMFTTCCGTLMCGTSELYLGGSIVVPSGPTVVSNDRPLDLVAWTKF